MATPIPQPSGIPLLGNIFDIDPKNTWPSLQKLWEKYGEIFKVTIFGQQIVFVGSVALCEEICDEKRFRKYVGGPIVEIRYSVHDSLFAAFDKEPSWGIAHRIIAPLLSPTAIKDTFTEMRDTTSELVAKWKGLGGDENKVLAIDELNRLSLEATTLCLFGKRLNGLKGPAPTMIAAMEGATSEAIMRPTRPRLLNWLWYQTKFETDTKTMRTYAADLLEYRKSHPDAHGKDLLYAMMNAKDPDTGESLDEQRIIDEIVTMPIGSSTAPGLVSTAIYYLLKNPTCISKAREEISSVVGSSQLSRDHLDKLPYIEGIMRESLRLSAAAPGFNIEPIPSDSTAPVPLAGGKYEVPAKQTMIIVLHGVNRDPAVFDAPEEFKPERMMGAAFDKLSPGTRKWFGNGKRECIGKHYAWQWNMVTLAKLLSEVDFEMADPDYKLKQDGWFNLRPVDFYVKVKVRAS